ncbi:hypothetical protein ACI3PW_01285 [Glaesserella parasuis]|uniref:hypothetical protein n=1 Tax=Glaesserella parasuis TaxID=738 RepID=UPI003853C55A
MKMPDPNNYDSDWDYYEACEAYQAYLYGKPHSSQPIFVKQKLAQNDPDSNSFVNPKERF